jgi:hypothetical protein
VLWAIVGIFWAANAILLVALFQGGQPPSSRYVGPVLSAVGFLFSAAWFGLQRRALSHIARGVGGAP